MLSSSVGQKDSTGVAYQKFGLVYVLFLFGAITPGCIQSLFWLYTEESLLIVLKGPYVVSKIELTLHMAQLK